jgi:spore coat polysaccharide biosynthesis protein SpsF
MLTWVVERTRRATLPDEVVVATTTDASDDAIVEHCQAQGFPSYRGHPVDVLDRYYTAAQAFQAGIIIRVTADCPLIDPGLIDRTVAALLGAGKPSDYAANRLPWKRTYPIGLDVEACTREVLDVAWLEAREAHQREHVMPYLYEHPERFTIQLIDAEMDYGNMRWTVDTDLDLAFIREIAARLPDRTTFDWRDVLALLAKHPELKEINASVMHKTHRDVG